MAEKRSGTETRDQSQEQQRGMERASGRGGSLATRRDPFDIFTSGPFALMRRLTEDMDRMLGSFAGGGRAAPALFRQAETTDWTPAIDVFQRGNELVIRADMPGLSADDVTVEIGDDAVTISGERTIEREDDREGTFRREVAYGRFYRVIPLPQGAVTDNATATFNNGVLEIVVPTPSQEVRRGRRVEIGQGAAQGTQSRQGSTQSGQQQR